MALADAGERVRVIVYTTTHRVEGTYSKRSAARLLDDLNTRRDFIPITNVKIASLVGEPVSQFQPDFLALNRNHIVFITAPELDS